MRDKPDVPEMDAVGDVGGIGPEDRDDAREGNLRPKRRVGENRLAKDSRALACEGLGLSERSGEGALLALVTSALAFLTSFLTAPSICMQIKTVR